MRIPSRRSTTLCVAVVLVATFALADVASADDVSPINPNNRPTALPG
ncbi:MAG: hypothetical protein QOJ71_2230, partial [Actinomycetota bacterium]|nr:hypothetical protein [Actinomycetota bacterium]